MSLGTVVSNKDNYQTYSPLLLAAFTFAGQSTPGLLVSTTPVTLGSSIGILPSGTYLGRIAQQDIDAFQHRSQLGIDKPSKVAIHLFDADKYIWNNYVMSISTGTAVYGFRGATLQLALVMWQPGTSNFTTDAPVMFVGSCDMEVAQEGGNILVVTANNSHDMATIKLPMFPIQNRCPKAFPANATQRQSALTDPSSPFYLCGYSAGISGGVGNTTTPNLFDSYGNQISDGSGNYIICDFLRSDPTRSDQHVGCMARLGNYGGTSVAPDGDIWHDQGGHITGRFAGVQWSPGTYYAIAKNYTSQSKQAVFSFLNQSVLGQYQNLLYGTQWVNPKIANIIESGNDTKCKAMICSGNIGNTGVTQVLANGINITRAPSGDNNLWWDFVSYGNRGGNPGGANNDTGYSNSSYSALDDPYGSIATLEVVFYSQIFTGFGVPTIQVLSTGPQVWVYAPIGLVSGNGTTLTITFATGVANQYINGTVPYTVQIFGNTLAAANGNYNTVSGSTYGPPGTVSVTSSVGGTGTGGYIGGLSPYQNTNPAWVLLDVLVKANWTLPEINLLTFFTSALFCDTSISYINNIGNTATHARFKCQFVLENRMSAAEVVAGILRCCNGYLYWDQSGLLCMGINQTLADQQSSPVTGSNYNTPVSSHTASGGSANGYLAYLFDETTIDRVGQGDNERLDVEGMGNATILTPNEIFIKFQDEDNGYVLDSLGQIDPDAVIRAGGALQPGGSLVPETLNVLGIPNMDQAGRIANVYIAERQYGNPGNDPRGTMTFEFGTSVRAETLRAGHIIGLTLSSFGFNKQLFRVIKRVDSTNSQTIRLTVQWHSDIWYEDAYGQQPQAFYSNAGFNNPARAPLPWQAFLEQPIGTMWSGTDWFFQLAEIDTIQANGLPQITLQISGKIPVNMTTSLAHPPLVPVFASTSTASGSVPAGNYVVQICSIDTGGNYSAPSSTINVTLSATGNFTINGLGWDSSTAGYDLFVGDTHYALTHQFTSSPGVGSMPSSINVASLPNVQTYGPPDLSAAFLECQGKLVLHAGIIGAGVIAVSSTTVTISPPPSGSLANLAGLAYKLMLIGRPNLEAPLPITVLNITSNANNVITTSINPSSYFSVGDAVVITSHANITSANTIGDLHFVSAYAPSGVALTDVGFIVRIIFGTGEGQYSTITAVTSSTHTSNYDTYTVSPPWVTPPDNTSVFIVEEPGWRFGTSATVLNSSVYGSGTLVSTMDVSNYGGRAILVQPLIFDDSGIQSSNLQQSPVRVIWLSGVQGTRTIGASGTTMLPTDNTVLFDTSGISLTTTTLNGAVSNSVTTFVLASSYTPPNNTYCTVLAESTNTTESVYVTAGAGTTSITVVRAQLGTAASAHSNGATVDMPGSLTYTCLPLSQVPNQTFIFHKESSDISYVIIAAAGGEQFPDGSNQILLVDNSSGLGTAQIKSPGA